MKNTVFNLNRDLDVSTLSVGDTVTFRDEEWYRRFRNDINNLKNECEIRFYSQFEKYLGKSFKISGLTYVNIRLDNGLYVSPYMLEEIKPKEKYHIDYPIFNKGDIVQLIYNSDILPYIYRHCTSEMLDRDEFIVKYKLPNFETGEAYLCTHIKNGKDCVIYPNQLLLVSQRYKKDINPCKEIFNNAILEKKNEYKEVFITSSNKTKLITNIKTENYE